MISRNLCKYAYHHNPVITNLISNFLITNYSYYNHNHGLIILETFESFLKTYLKIRIFNFFKSFIDIFITLDQN